jgi:hypothetical protein
LAAADNAPPSSHASKTTHGKPSQRTSIPWPEPRYRPHSCAKPRFRSIAVQIQGGKSAPAASQSVLRHDHTGHSRHRPLSRQSSREICSAQPSKSCLRLGAQTWAGADALSYGNTSEVRAPVKSRPYACGEDIRTGIVLGWEPTTHTHQIKSRGYTILWDRKCLQHSERSFAWPQQATDTLVKSQRSHTKISRSLCPSA